MTLCVGVEMVDGWGGGGTLISRRCVGSDRAEGGAQVVEPQGQPVGQVAGPQDHPVPPQPQETHRREDGRSAGRPPSFTELLYRVFFSLLWLVQCFSHLSAFFRACAWTMPRWTAPCCWRKFRWNTSSTPPTSTSKKTHIQVFKWKTTMNNDRVY